MFDQDALFANVTNLSQLVEVCNNLDDETAELMDWSNLPTFGDEPADTQEIFSWDDTSLMFNDRGRFCMIDRNAWIDRKEWVKV